MAIINYTDQIKYAGKGYLDAKMMPVKTVDDLKAISLTQRFEGLTITVLNDGAPQDYWLVGGITNNHWVPKTNGGDFNELKLVLEEGFLKLQNGDTLLGEAVDLNEFFPTNPDSPTPSPSQPDLYIATVDYTTTNDKDENGVFICFTYSDRTRKYLDMSRFLPTTYEAGSGIVINGNVISLDDAIEGNIIAVAEELANVKTLVEDEISNRKASIEDVKNRINAISQEISNTKSELQSQIDIIADEIANEKNERETADNEQKESINTIRARIENLIVSVESNTNSIAENKTDINTNAIEIATLKERVNALSAAAEGSTPDGETIGITNDESKALYVKILNKDGNMLSKGVNDEGESGLYASIPIFCEDDEL